MRPIIRDLGIFTKNEQKTILCAIFHHTDFDNIHHANDELIKDAVFVQQHFYNVGKPVLFGNRKLRPKSSNIFYVDDISVELKFRVDSNDQATGFILGEKDSYANRKEEGTPFVRVPEDQTWSF